MLWCKPSRKAGILLDQPIEKGQNLSLRSLYVKQDLGIIQSWPGNSSLPILVQRYQTMYKKADRHAFVVLLDEQLFYHIDLQCAAAADLGRHIGAQANECVIQLQHHPGSTHLLHGLTLFCQWYFGFSDSGHLYAETDIYNSGSCRLLEQAGFYFYRNLMLTDRAASVYILTRQQFQSPSIQFPYG